MQSMCLNCKHYDGLLDPWCNKFHNATHPAMKCHVWETNQNTPAHAGKEDK